MNLLRCLEINFYKNFQNFLKKKSGPKQPPQFSKNFNICSSSIISIKCFGPHLSVAQFYHDFSVFCQFCLLAGPAGTGKGIRKALLVQAMACIRQFQFIENGRRQTGR